MKGQYQRPQVGGIDARAWQAITPVISAIASRFLNTTALQVPFSTTGGEWRTDWEEYRRELESLTGHERVWVMLSHIWQYSGVNEELLFAFFLDDLGHRLESSCSLGAVLYLYDLSNTAVVQKGT